MDKLKLIVSLEDIRNTLEMLAESSTQDSSDALMDVVNAINEVIDEVKED